jgi:hypothetical protein
VLKRVRVSSTQLRRFGLGATVLSGLSLFCTPLEARPRCPVGQIYRPSLGICQSKLAKGAQPYVKRRTAGRSPQQTGSVRPERRTPPATPSPRISAAAAASAPPPPPAAAPVPAAAAPAPEPPSIIPFVEPKAQGSLNPLPQWKAGL